MGYRVGEDIVQRYKVIGRPLVFRNTFILFYYFTQRLLTLFHYLRIHSYH